MKNVNSVFRGPVFFAMIFTVLLAASTALAAPPAPAVPQKSQDVHIGVKGGYNYADMVVDMIYEEHPSLTVWHIAGYAGYDFGIVKVTGTLWNYFLNAGDGVWRVQDDNPIDQTYIEMGPNGVFGPTVDISFDVPVSRRVLFNPGLGIGIGFRYGSVTQFDYQSRPGAVAPSKDDLTEDQVRPEEKDNGKTFTTVLPLIHIDLDWTILIDRNWFATVNLGFQTFGPSAGLGVGYQF